MFQKESSKCKGLEGQRSLSCSRNPKEAEVVAADRLTRGVEGAEAAGATSCQASVIGGTCLTPLGNSENVKPQSGIT